MKVSLNKFELHSIANHLLSQSFIINFRSCLAHDDFDEGSNYDNFRITLHAAFIAILSIAKVGYATIKVNIRVVNSIPNMILSGTRKSEDQ